MNNRLKAFERDFSFVKADRIRTAIEYRTLSKAGKRYHDDYFTAVFRNNSLSRARLGITVSKKVGKAVTRNRIKRIIREYFRLNRILLPGRLDINIIAKPSSGMATTEAINVHLGSCFERIAATIAPEDDE